MIMNSTESHAVIPTASFHVSLTQQTRPAKITQIINMSVSVKRSKNQNDSDVSCDVCSLQSIKGKPGKKCKKCNLWIYNKCMKLHVHSCSNVF